MKVFHLRVEYILVGMNLIALLYQLILEWELVVVDKKLDSIKNSQETIPRCNFYMRRFINYG